MKIFCLEFEKGKLGQKWSFLRALLKAFLVIFYNS